jgi:hypothetical protein
VYSFSANPLPTPAFHASFRIAANASASSFGRSAISSHVTTIHAAVSSRRLFASFPSPSASFAAASFWNCTLSAGSAVPSPSGAFAIAVESARVARIQTVFIGPAV